MKRIQFLSVIFLLMTLSLFAKGQQEIHVGYMGNLSGRGSELWVQARNGLELAVEQYNQEQKKFNIILHTIDHQGLDELAVQAIDDFKNQGVSIIFGPTTSGRAMALREFFVTEDILFLSATASSDELSGFDDYLLRTSATAYAQGEQLAALAFEREGDRRFVCVTDTSNSSYTGLVLNGFVEEVQNLGGQISEVLQFDSQNELPFVELAEQVVALDPQGVLIVSNDLDGAALIQQIFKRNPELHYYTPSWANSTAFISNGGQAVEGSYQVGSFDFDSDFPPYVEFREAFFESFGFDPIFTAPRYYETFQVFRYALDQVGEADIHQLKNAIIERGTYSFVMGEFHIDAMGDCDRPLVIVQVEGGRALPLPME